MGTRDEAIEVLSEHMGESLSTDSERESFCSQFQIRAFKDGWLFQTKPKGRGHDPSPLWWMVVGHHTYGFHFFKMSNIRAYAAAQEASGAMAN